MNGSRTIGSRKHKLLSGPMMRQFMRLNKKGINGMAYLSRKYKMKLRNLDDFAKVPTKNISGMISDLAEIK